MTPLAPVKTVHLFPEERAALLSLLESFAEEQWATPDVYPGWTAKDIAQHLLADDFGRLSRGRDAYLPALFKFTNPETFEADLLDFINRQNEFWVEATRRLSPQIIIDLLRWSGEETQKYWESLDMDEMTEPVSWAGPEPAPVWLDVAREYTERWLHQQHLRIAVGAPLLYEKRLYVPVLDTFVRALPHTYRNTIAPEGAHIRLTLTGLGAKGRRYDLVRRDNRWELLSGLRTKPTASATMPAETAWKLFTKTITVDDARPAAKFAGDIALAETILQTVSIIA